MRGLPGKSAIVTGGATGIGRAIMQRLCQEGVSVTFTDMSEDGHATQDGLSGPELAVQFVRGDMADEDFCRAAVAAAVAQWGGVDFLVNNAFSFIAKGADATRDDWNRMMQVGPIGYATMGQLAAEAMKTRGGGAIVNISSISAHIAQPNRWTYNAAKGAVNQLTRCMALDLAPLRHPRQHAQPGLDLDTRGRQGMRRRPRHVGADLGQVPHFAAARRTSRRLRGPRPFC